MPNAQELMSKRRKLVKAALAARKDNPDKAKSLLAEADKLHAQAVATGELTADNVQLHAMMGE